jgi:hypothetical protein
VCFVSHSSFCAHIHDLFSLAFSPEESNLHARAFAVLDFAEPTLMREMLANNLLHSIAFKILDQANPRSLLLSRLSSLTVNAFETNPESARDRCGFIFQLFYYLFEPMVVSLFETICADHDGDRTIADWLLSLSFPQVVFNEIENLCPPADCSRGSAEANRICGLFHVFTFAARSPQLRPAFCTPSFAEVVCKYSGEYPDFIEDCRWEALAVMYGSATGELLRGMFHSAIQILQTESRNVCLAGVAAIELLTQMIRADSILRPFISSDVIKDVLKLLLANPNHSILQAVSREFLCALLLHPKTRLTAAKAIVPEVLEALTSADNRSLLASLFEIIQTAANIGKTDVEASVILKAFEGFGQLTLGPLAQRNSIMNRSFGGSLPSPSLGDVKALVNSAHGQRYQ